MATDGKWLAFAGLADQYFVAYACTPHICVGPAYQDLAHSIELYLKAALIKVTGDAQQARKHGHSVGALLRECQRMDSTFLPRYVLRHSVLDAPLWNRQATERVLSKDDCLHFLDQQELYFIAHHQLAGQIKYLGANPKGISGPYGYAQVFPNPFWIQFVKELRSHIGYPPPTHLDFIRDVALDPAFARCQVPSHAQVYLEQLC